MWVLILMAFAGSGQAITTIPMANEDACIQAESTINKDEPIMYYRAKCLNEKNGLMH